MKELNDELQIHISVKWMAQLIFFIITVTGSWFSLKATITDNEKEIKYIKQNLIEYEKQVDDRVSRLEKYKEQELEEVNKSLLSKVLGNNE
tara:strand:- start:372 stop:644 length:273 start_codon:yes stop_codon:yes gene_type:complete